jgi:hypothetical protein
MKNYADTSVVCPFYTQEEGCKMHCEGFNFNTRIFVWFDSKEAMARHKGLFCRNIKRYEKCPLYHPIAEKYGEEDEDDK